MEDYRTWFMILILPAALLSANGRSLPETPEDKLVGCYYTNYAQYRPDIGRFTVDHIGASLCTHIFYAFATLKTGRLSASEKDDEDNYKRVTEMKARHPHLKVLLTVGGYALGPGPFSQLMRSRSQRNRFVTHAARFLRGRNFDGLDIAWEYPADQSRGGSQFDKTLYPEFLHVDYINLRSFDYHGPWEAFTGHNAPLLARSDDNPFESTENLKWTVDEYIRQGTPPGKLVVGIAAYGSCFRLIPGSGHGIAAPARGPCAAAPYTVTEGIMAYYEVCDKLRNGSSTRVFDTEQQVPYAFSDSAWTGYDDTVSIQHKMDFVEEIELAGAYIWTLDFDDFTGHCGSGKYPLLQAINAALRPMTSTSTTESTTTPTPSQTTVLPLQSVSMPERTTVNGRRSTTRRPPPPTTTRQPRRTTTRRPRPLTTTQRPRLTTTQRPRRRSSTRHSLQPPSTTHKTTNAASPSTTSSSSSGGMSTRKDSMPDPSAFTTRDTDGGTQRLDNDSTTPFETTPLPTTPFETTPFETTPFETTPFETTPFPTKKPGGKQCAQQAFTCSGNGSFRNPHHCGQFYMCVFYGTPFQQVYLLDCPVKDLLVFDEETHTCIYYFDVENYAERCTCQEADPITLR
ncbi:PREDICTED: chitinase-3-like protein 2 [Priapulus caudatus]|uniref:Chitinase-3-like protein 2 n=1 Tax=Priapulus caudatus TaxID=37621 RepID=A0ABM1EPG9_PRICU|nr:PREDICTED: chitinase-3-like protein 2 [Priapulus caudatus]